MEQLTVASLDASADEESSSLSSQLFESYLSRLRCQYGIDARGGQVVATETAERAESVYSYNHAAYDYENGQEGAQRSEVARTTQGINALKRSSRSCADVGDYRRCMANERPDDEDADLRRQNSLLQALVERQTGIIAQLRRYNADQERELRRQEDNFRDLVTDMQTRYDEASAHFQQQIADLKQKLQLMDVAAHPAPAVLAAPEVQLAKYRQETLLMDQQLQMLSYELQYRQQLGYLSAYAFSAEAVYQINAQTLEIVYRNQQQMLSRQIEAARIQQEQYNLLLAKNQQNIISAYNKAAAAQGIPLAAQTRVTQAQTAQQTPQAAPSSAKAPNSVKQLSYGMQGQPDSAQRPANLIQHNYTPRIQQMPPYNPGMTPEQVQVQAQTYTQASGAASATIVRQPQTTDFGDQKSRQAESLMLSATNHPVSSTPMKKSVKFVDSPPEDFVYKQLAPTVKAPPQIPTKRLEQESTPAARRPAQSELEASQHALQANSSGVPAQYQDDVPVEHLVNHFPIQKRGQVERSSRITGFREEKLGVAPGKDIPKLKEALSVYMQTHLGQQYKIYDKQLHIAEIMGDYLGVSAQEALQQVVKSRECYDRVVDMLQQLGHSTTMSQLQILLRVHDVFVRYVTFDDLERLRKEERMPRPEGSGTTVVRLPLMQGKKWLVAALVQ